MESNYPLDLKLSTVKKRKALIYALFTGGTGRLPRQQYQYDIMPVFIQAPTCTRSISLGSYVVWNRNRITTLK